MIEKSWGWENVVEENDEYAVKLLYMRKGEHCSMHYHEHKRETITCIVGQLAVVFLVRSGRNTTLSPGETITIPAGQEYAHRMRATDAWLDTLYLESTGPDHQDDVRRVDNE